MTTTYPALAHLARSYLHQDFWEEYGDPRAAVDDFLDGEPELAPLLAGEVERALAEHPDEAATRHFVQDVLDSMYACEDDGLSYRDWLRSVAGQARAADSSTD